MSRINRRNWTEEKIGYKEKGGVFDLFDNMFKSVLRITDTEMDKLALECSDEELKLAVTEQLTFTEKRELINLLNKYITYE